VLWVSRRRDLRGFEGHLDGQMSAMKAAIVEHRGDHGSLHDMPMPQPGAHDVLVRVTAASVNPIDWKTLQRADRQLPFVLGQDFAGVVSATGNRVTKYREGERIFGIAREHGAYAEYTLVPEDDHAQPVAKIPDDVGDADAASLPTAGLTALASLEALRVRADTTVLILGATGGVGGFAVQMAHGRGARIVATARSSNEALARSLGASDFIAYDTEDVVQTLRTRYPDGVEAVLDLVDDGSAIKLMADAMGEDGQIVSTIGAADIDWFAQRNLFATNLVMGETPQSSHAGLRQLLELLQTGTITVRIAGERPLSEAAEALEQSQGGQVDGKLVITVA
jgi:NADPH:quinone reductase-like Zn-dependent oxidoreductase